MAAEENVLLYVTHIDDSYKGRQGQFLYFWGQKNREVYDLIEKALKEIHHQLESSIPPINIFALESEVFCVPLNNQWVRAKLLRDNEATRTGAAEVLCIDFGIVQTVPLAFIRCLNGTSEQGVFLTQCQPLATKFVLADVVCPQNHWPETSFEYLKKHVQDRLWYGVCLGSFNDLVGIRLYSLKGELLAKVLHDFGLIRPAQSYYGAIKINCPNQVPCLLTTQPPPPFFESGAEGSKFPSFSIDPVQPPSRPHNNIESIPAPQQQKVSPLGVGTADRKIYLASNLKRGIVHEVYITRVENGLCKFTVQFKEADKELPKLRHRLDNIQLKSMKNPTRGSPCIALYSQDHLLYRGLVTYAGEEECNVYYVDYGNSEILNTRYIFEIPDELVGIKLFTCRATLAEADELNSLPGVEEAFKTLVLGKLFNCEVVSDDIPQKVTLYDDKGRNVKDMIMELLHKQIPLTFKPSPELPVDLPPRVDLFPKCPLAQALVRCDMEFDRLELNGREKVFITFVPGVGQFFGQLEKRAVYELELVQKELSATYGSASNPPMLYADVCEHTGHCAVVKWSADNNFYRVRVHEEFVREVEVWFVDYGNIIRVNRRQVLAPVDSLTRFRTPPFGFHCCVEGVNLPLERWEKLVMDNSFEIQPGTCNGGFYTATFTDHELNQTVLQSIKYSSDVLRKSPRSIVENATDQNISEWNPRGSNYASNPEGNFEQNWVSPKRNEDFPGDRYGKKPERSSFLSEHFNHDIDFGSDPRRSHEDDVDSQHSGRRSDGSKSRNQRGSRGNRRSGRSRISTRGSRNGSEGSQESVRHFNTNEERSAERSNRGAPRSRKPGTGGPGSRRGRSGPGRESNRGSKYDSGNNYASQLSSSEGPMNIPLSPLEIGTDFDWGTVISKSLSSNVEHSKPLEFLPQPTLANVKKQLEVVYVNNPSDFHCQLSEAVEALDNLMAQIASVYADETKPSITNPTIGMPCIARFVDDESWYRGQILDVVGNEIEVYFVDYGNKQRSQLETIKVIDEKMLEIPPQAYHCRLASISAPLTWTADDKATFEGLVIGKKLQATVLHKGPDNIYVVRLVHETDDGEHLVINERFGAPAVSNVEAPVDDYVSFPLQTLPCDISISWYYHPGKFYVAPASVSEYQSMLVKLDEFYSSLSSNELMENEPRVDLPCIARFEEDNVYYRAQILAIQDQMAEVLFVDFGNKQEVQLTDLRRIVPVFMTFPKLAIPCCLREVRPVIPPKPEFRRHEMECFGSSELKATFFPPLNDGLCSVEIQHSSIGDVTEFFIRNGIVEKTTVPNAAAVQLLPPQNDYAKGDIISSKALISYIGSGDEFWIQPDPDLVETIMANIDSLTNEAEFYSKPSLEPVFDKSCLALFLDDHRWYRATIQNVDHEKVSVNYVDYGNSGIVGTDQLKELPPSLAEHGHLALRCALDGIHDISEPVTEAFQNLVLEITVKVKYITKKDGKIYVRLYDDADTDLNEQLGLSAEVNEKYVYVSYVCSPNLFWVQLVEDENEIYRIGEQLANHFEGGNGDSILTNLETNRIYAARHPNDSLWYRVKLEEIEKDSVKAHFLDYGDSHQISCSEVRLCPAELEAVEGKAIKCALSFNEEIQEWPDQIKESFVELTEGGAAKCRAIFGPKLGDIQVLESLIINGIDIKQKLGLQGNDYISERKQSKECINTVTGQKTQEKLERRSHEEDCTVLNQQLGFSAEAIEKCVYISYICSPNLFWVQCVEEENEIYRIGEQLANHFEGDNGDSILTNLETNRIYAARHPNDSLWYRVKLEEIEKDCVKAHFFDYGDSHQIPCSEIRLCPAELETVEGKAIKCALKFNEEPKEWPDQTKKFFVELTEGGAAKCHAVFGPKLGDMQLLESLVVNDIDVKEKLYVERSDSSGEEKQSDGCVNDVAQQMTTEDHGKGESHGEIIDENEQCQESSNVRCTAKSLSAENAWENSPPEPEQLRDRDAAEGSFQWQKNPYDEENLSTACEVVDLVPNNLTVNADERPESSDVVSTNLGEELDSLLPSGEPVNNVLQETNTWKQENSFVSMNILPGHSTDFPEHQQSVKELCKSTHTPKHSVDFDHKDHSNDVNINSTDPIQRADQDIETEKSDDHKQLPLENEDGGFVEKCCSSDERSVANFVEKSKTCMEVTCNESLANVPDHLKSVNLPQQERDGIQLCTPDKHSAIFEGGENSKERQPLSSPGVGIVSSVSSFRKKSPEERIVPGAITMGNLSQDGNIEIEEY